MILHGDAVNGPETVGSLTVGLAGISPFTDHGARNSVHQRHDPQSRLSDCGFAEAVALRAGSHFFDAGPLIRRAMPLCLVDVREHALPELHSASGAASLIRYALPSTSGEGSILVSLCGLVPDFLLVELPM